LNKKSLELRHRLAARDLAEIAALRRRGTGRELLRQLSEPLWRRQNFAKHGLRLLLGSRGGVGVLRVGREQDVGRLEQVGAAKALQVLLVEAPARRLVGLRRPHFARDQRPDQGLLVGLALVRIGPLERVRPDDAARRRRLQ
jgi:hypothetical protein